MKRTNTSFYTRRTLILTLISFVAVAALVSFGVSARRANRAAALRLINSKVAAQPVTTAQDKKPNAPDVAAMTATLTDNTASPVAPGGTINYTAVITNNGAASPADDALSVVYNGNLDANTTISGLVGVSPVPLNDTYPQTVIGNVQVNSANIPYSVVTNDYQGQNGGVVSIGTSGTSTNGGQVVMNNTPGPNFGQFTYNPPAGFEGNDTFTYTLTNSVGSTTAATVTIPVAGMVWFINNNSAVCTTVVAGCGRITNPWSDLTSFNLVNNGGVGSTNPAVNDNIFIYESAIAYVGPITLLNGQRLIGQDSTSTLAALTGLTPPSGSTPFPAMNSGNGTITKITTGAGNGITLNSAAGSNLVNGLTVGNTAGVGISGSSFGAMTLADVSIDEPAATRTGQALSLTTGVVTATFGTVESSTGTNNVNLVSVTGNVNLGTGALSGATGNALTMSGAGNTASVSYAGTITNTTASAVSIANKTGGTVALSGLITGSGSGANGGISLLTNTGTTMNFTGGINLNMTGAAPGFTATGGGTVSATQNNTTILNTLTTATGTALNVTGTTIGASGLTFRSITSNGAGANTGIVLSATGSSGGVTVVGNSAAGTGGTIANKTGADGSTTNGNGIYLNDTQSPSFSWMQLNDFQNFAILGTTVRSFTLANSVINGTNGTNENVDEGSVSFTNLTGSASISNTTIGGAREDTFRVVNTTAGSSLNRITFDNITLNSNNTATGDNGLFLQAQNTATLNATVINSDFNGARGDQLQFDLAHGTGSPTGDLILTNNNFINTHPAVVVGGGGVTLSGGGVNPSAVSMTYDIDGNTFRGARGDALLIALQVGQGTFTGRVRNNTFGLAATDRSGSLEATNIEVRVVGGGTSNVTIDNNQIRQYSNFGILLQAGNAVNGGSGTLNATVSDNIIANPSTFGFIKQGIQLNGGTNAGDAHQFCTDILNNTTGGSGDGGGPDIQTRHRFNTTVRLPGYAGATFDTAAVVTYLQNRNTGAEVALASTSAAGGGYINGVAGCGTPVAALPSIQHEYLAGTSPQANSGAQTAAVAGATSSTNAEVFANHYNAVTKQGEDAQSGALRSASSEFAKVATDTNQSRRSHHARFNRKQAIKAVKSGDEPLAPTSGEAVGPINIGTLPAGKSVTITYAATVNTPPLARQASHQGTVTYTNGPGSPLVTNDPDTGPANDATVTQIDVLSTWVGGISTDWNTATNWNPSTYAPGVSNPAVNDVVIPAVGLQPSISATDIGIYSLNISATKVLTITSPRVLTIGGSPGGNLTLDGIISGGNLNLGTGTHAFNVGASGSLSSTNVATVLSGSIVTLNNNLQAGALAVNAGGSMNITNRTLSLNGSGAALTVPGGATFTTTGSTVVFNGTAAQQAAGIAYNNLTINNTIGTFVTGVTLTGNATVNGALALTSSDLNTGAFTLTQPNTTASTGVSDVVGTIARTGGPPAIGTPLTFGNPNNIITFTAGASRPTTMTVTMAKNPPATYAAAVARNYQIEPTGGAGYTATLRLHYRDAELNGNDETSIPNFNLRRGPSWNAVIPTARNTAGTDDNWLESNAVTQFSQWTFANLAPTASGGTITGRIVDDNGAPVEGAVVRLSGAQNRKFITDANGVYRFENVETGGFYNVTPTRVNYNFSPAVISFSQLGETTEAAFGATATGSTVNPLDTPEYFVRQNYIDFLGREPDEAGFNFWSDQILACGEDTECVDRKRTHVSAAYFLSIEFQQTGGLVDGLYRASFGRRPSYGEFKPDAAVVAPLLVVNSDGWQTVLENGKAAFVDGFVQRPGFQSVYGSLSNDAYVDALIANTGVSFTGAERNALVSGLGGGMTRAAVLRTIVEDADFVAAKRNDAFVMMEYFGYLRREPDAAGFDYWLNKLIQFNGNFEQAEMVRSFIVSTEYRQRFPK
ncbi:MAG TPA: DUF4214 domain-containing protein [Pyrinomonadaceae bacterium]|nr:DUF4214 domain-containing protein [Pyrinomonadaceae bacterium]